MPTRHFQSADLFSPLLTRSAIAHALGGAVLFFGVVNLIAQDGATSASEPEVIEAKADAEPGGDAPETTAADTSGAEATDSASGDPDASAGGEGQSEQEDQADGPKKIAVSFRGTELSQIANFLGRELDKPVLIHQSVANLQITVMSNKELPISEALELLGNALRQNGVIIVEGPRQIELLPIDQVRRVNRPLVDAHESVADLPDQSTIIDKVFLVEHYDVNRLKDLVVPMLPEYAFLVADPNLDRLVVTAAAADLVHVERMIARLDVPRANDTVERIFTIKNGDASEIATMVRTILAGTLGNEGMEVFTTPGAQGNNANNNRNRNNRNRGGGNSGNNEQTNTLFVERSEAPIMLQADLSRNWIIAAAPPTVMETIEKWVEELDQPKDRNEPYALFDITHADVEELSGQINEAINAMPDADIRNSVRVIPFVKSRQILVYGSQRGRALVRSLLDQLDIESSQFQLIKEIQLEHDSAENVKAKIEELFSNTPSGSGNRFYFRGGSQPKKDLTVTADTQRNTVTIMTDAVKMRRIEEIIDEQWDLPVDLDEVKPKVYELEHTDPVQVQTLLEEMFTKSSSTSSFSWFSGQRTTETNTPVGRLFGEFSFNAMQDSNKLIVSTKNPANYAVIDDLLEEIDQPQDAGVPVIIELKHANAEDVAEQLNAMFAEPGTPAAITRNERGLSDAIREISSASERSAGGNNNQNNNQNRNFQGGGGGENDPTQMNFWWSQSRPNINEQPTSNLIGKPRVVPVNRRNAIMILAPRAHVAPLRDLVAELDQPGMQVVIHAIITEVQHDDETTLGVRFASDPSLFDDSRLADQAIGGGVNANYAETIFRGDGVLNANVNLNLLIQLLVKNLDLSVITEPRLMTADNQEAHFFDGQDIPVITGDFTGNNSNGNVTRSFRYEPVGTRLHARPHITQDGEIDLKLNLELSRVVNGATVFGNFIFDRRTTTTHVTLEDGQTIVISGIIEQEDFQEIRKFPLLGDLPVLGGLFRSTDTGVRNREVIAFVTPHIVQKGRAAEETTQTNRQWLERIRGAMANPEAVDGDGREGEGNDDTRRFTSPEERGVAPVTPE